MTPRRLMMWQFELLESALAAGTTIALRTTDVMAAGAAGKLPEQREASRMVTEKAEAFSAGLAAAMRECSRLWWRTALTGSVAPFGLASTWLELTRAAWQPARTTARRNARRLTRRLR